MDQIMTGAATPAQIAGLRRVDEDEAADVGRGDRAGRHDAALRPPSADRRDRHRHRRRGRHRRRRRQHREPVHDGRRSWWRPPGCRWSSTATGPRRPLSGGADTLEALGVRIDLGPDEVARSVAEVGIGFAFAPQFHPSYRHAASGAPRDRRADGVQSAWAADESGCAAGRADRLRVGRSGRGDGRGVRHPPLQRAGGARRRRARRADHDDDEHHLAGAGGHRGAADLRSGGVRVRARRIRAS